MFFPANESTMFQVKLKFLYCILYVSLVCTVLSNANAAATNTTSFSPYQNMENSKNDSAADTSTTITTTPNDWYDHALGLVLGCGIGQSIGSIIPGMGNVAGCFAGATIGVATPYMFEN